MKKNDISDNVLSKVLQSLDNGWSMPQVLKVYSKHKLELEELLQIIQMLQREKANIVPSQELLYKILMHLDFEQIVTKQQVSRYIDRGIEKSQVSVVETTNQNYNQNMNWKVFLPIGAVIVIVVILMSVGGGKPSLPQPVPTISESETQEISTGSPTLDNELNSIIEAAASGDDLSEPVADFGEVSSDLDLISI